MKKIGVVITTISDGSFLDKHTQAISETKHEVIFYIIGDHNTPALCQENCIRINANHFSCKYYTIEDQEKFLNAINFPLPLIPYKSDNRRNVGYLVAVQEGCDIIISMDDDNFPVDNNFYDGHSIVGDSTNAIELESKNNWFNPMCMLTSKNDIESNLHIYPRGYPYEKKWDDHSTFTGSKIISGKVGINVGLWTGDPDVDAVTRLATNCLSDPNKNWEQDKTYALNQKYLMPINSQNTAIHRDAIVAYYFVKMGYPIQGMKMDRFGDIFSGYFLLLCNQAVGNLTTIGAPLVYQDRNEHNLFKDLQIELPGVLIIEELIPFLESGLAPASNYVDAYQNLIELLHAFIAKSENKKFWDSESVFFFEEITKIMSSWITAFKLLK